MPCTVYTEIPDMKTHKAYRAHHEKVEAILEDVLLGRLGLIQGIKRYEEARALFAAAVRSAWHGWYGTEKALAAEVERTVPREWADRRMKQPVTP